MFAHRFRAISFFLLFVLTVPFATQAQTDPDIELRKKIDALLDEAFPAELPGAAAVVLRGGEEVYRAAKGKANLELDVPLNAEMVFRLGSITKQFTAAAIMMLVEEGKVALDDEITKFLPDYPTQGTRITVRHLLNHTSGIRSYTGIPGWMQTRVVNDYSVSELINGFKDEPMDFKPGEEFRYNNSGYILLGAIIEKAAEKTYAEFIKERIFTPLKMTGSLYGEHDAIIQNRVPGYDGSKDQPRNAKYLSMTQPYAAGSLLSTVSDLGKWNTALFGGKVVNPESLKLMITDGKLNDGSSVGYGFGLVPGDLRGHKAVSHGGGIFGFATHGVYLPDDDIYVAVLANSTFMDPNRVAIKIAALAAGDPFPEFKAVEVNEKTLQQYVGVYKIDEQARRFVTLEDGKLFTKRTGGNRLEATPWSDTSFFYEQSPSHFEFVLEGDEVTGMNMYQAGSTQPELAVKVDEEMPAERKVAKIDFALYDDYVGEYELGPGFSISVTRDGDRLLAQATGQPEFQLFPASDTDFFLKVVEAELSFVRDENKEVNQIVLKQGGAEMTGQRK